MVLVEWEKWGKEKSGERGIWAKRSGKVGKKKEKGSMMVGSEPLAVKLKLRVAYCRGLFLNVNGEFFSAYRHLLCRKKGKTQ